MISTLSAGLSTDRFKKAIDASEYLGDTANFERRKVFDFFAHRSISFLPIQLAILVVAIKGYFLVELPTITLAILVMEISELITIYATGRALIAYERHDFDARFWRNVTMAIETKGLIAIIGAYTLAILATDGFQTLLVAFTWLTSLFFVMFVTSRQIIWSAIIIGAHVLALGISLRAHTSGIILDGFQVAPSSLQLPILLYVVMCFASAYLLINYTNRSLEKERSAAIKEREANVQRSLLNDEKTLLATIQHNLSEAIVMTDADGNIADSNRAFIDYFRTSSQKNIYDMFSDVYLKPDRTRRSMKTDDGRTILVEGMDINLAPPNPSLLFIFIDITDKVAVDERNQQLQKITLLGSLASGMAHDFNNYLSVIQSNTELMLHNLRNGDQDRDEDEARLNDILRACLSSSGQTRRLLRFTRKLPENPEFIATDAACKRALDIAASTLGALYQVDADIRATANIYVDPSHFETAILNLFINARDAMPSGGKIIFRAIQNGDSVTVQVIDDGPGIAPEILDRVTEPFFTTKPENTGSGIGLSNVAQFVEQYNGTLDVNSTEGKGAVISLTLPVAEEPANSEVVQLPEAADLTAEQSKKIILIDDNRPFTKSLQVYLNTRGHKVRAVNNVGDFTRTYKKEKADLIICDVILENENGLEVYDIVRAIGGNEPILFISGNLPEYFQEKIEKTKNTWFIEKPFSVGKLMLLINEILVDDISLPRDKPRTIISVDASSPLNNAT